MKKLFGKEYRGTMNKINLITPPDKLYNECFSILLISPTDFIKQQLQSIVQEIDIPINIYLYEEDNIDWLLDIASSVDYIVIDLDNCDSKVRELCSYFVAKPKTYWLTQGENTVYNMLSVNRIYDLEPIKNIMEKQL